MHTELNQLNHKTFLIVDDESMIREILIMEFEDLGVRCLEASNAHEAYHIAKNHHIDFVLCDVRMPNGSGIEFLEKMNQMESPDTVPIIMMSGFTDLSEKHAKDLGALAIISKPFALSEVLPMIIANLNHFVRKSA